MLYKHKSLLPEPPCPLKLFCKQLGAAGEYVSCYLKLIQV